MWVDQLPDHAIVVFDGWCGFCTRCVRLLARLDRHGRLELLAAQRDGVPERAAVTLDDAAAAAWTLAPGGVRASGAGAIGLALAVATGTRIPLLPWRLPGVPWLLERAYKWIVDNRRRSVGTLPGVPSIPAVAAGRCRSRVRCRRRRLDRLVASSARSLT